MTDETIQDFWEALADDKFLMVSRDGDGDHAIPMTAQTDKDAYGQFWFFTTKDNRLAAGGATTAQFVSADDNIFASLKGTLVTETDRGRLDALWSKPVEAWYEGGKDDPNLLMLRYELSSIEVWEQEMGLKGRFKLLTGQKIEPGEAGEHKEKIF